MSVSTVEKKIMWKLKDGPIRIREAQQHVGCLRSEIGQAFANLKRLGCIIVDCGKVRLSDKVRLSEHGRTLL